MGQVRDFIETLNERVRSPILGSILISFLVINWRPLFYLLLSDQEIETRFAFFDQSTSISTLYVFPVVVGIIIGLVAPWLSYFGSWVASQPVHRQRIMADRFASIRLHEKAKLAQAREYQQSVLEQSTIDRTKRDIEIDNIEDPETREKLRDEISLQRLEKNLAEAEETRDQAIGYMQQREAEITSQLSQTEAELRAAMEGLRDARRETEELKAHIEVKG